MACEILFNDSLKQSLFSPEVVNKDEFPRLGCSIEGLQKLRPAFVKDGSGTVTAGNASGLIDLYFGFRDFALCVLDPSTGKKYQDSRKILWEFLFSP